METDKSTIEKQLKSLAKEENTLKEIFVEKDKRLEQITIAITKQVEQKMKERKKKALAAKIKAAKL